MVDLEKTFKLLEQYIKHQVSFINIEEPCGFDCDYLINTIKQLQEIQNKIYKQQINR